MAKKKKVGASGSFRARYGLKPRRRWESITEKMRKPSMCPKCKHIKLKRISTGIFQCRKCGAKIAGGAYFPTTSAGISADRAIVKAKSEVKHV